MPSRGSAIGGGGGENNVLAEADDGGSVGLLGQFSCFKCDGFAAGETDCNCRWIWFHLDFLRNALSCGP